MPSFASFAAAISIAVLARAETHSVNLPSGFFNGPQTGIGSWFTAVSEGTNGKSWCGYPYSDSDPVFAVVRPEQTQMSRMLAHERHLVD